MKTSSGAIGASRLTIAAIVVGAALVVGGPARAATIDYIFTGVGSGTLGSSSFSNANFQFIIVGDTGAVVLSTPYTNSGAGSFSSGSLSASLSNTEVVLYNDTQSSTFPNVGFGQAQPSPVFFVEEALATAPGGGVFGSYNLETAFPLISSTTSGNSVSAIVQTYLTNNGDLTFNQISSLTFQAELAPTPLPAALSLFGTVLGAGGLLAGLRNRRTKKGADAIATA
jgi:hypothetical protein